MPAVAFRFVYSLPLGPAEYPSAIEEAFVAELWERGTLGIESRSSDDADRLRIHAYFPLVEPPSTVRGLAEPGLHWRRQGVAIERVQGVPSADWLARWRAAAQPLEVGRRFLLDPREPDDGATPSLDELTAAAVPRFLLRLPARGAFGTGSHESTRLALELLESMVLAGRSVLDVGTGTGVLAFAALALGAARAMGCDVDAVAAFHAGENRTLNGLHPTLWAGGLPALTDGARFDVVVANILPERIGPELPRLSDAVADGGSLVYSGTLAESSGEIRKRFAACGFAERSRRTAGEWLALEMVRE